MSEETKERAEETFDRYRSQVILAYDLWVQRKSIEDKLRVVVQKVIPFINEARARMSPPEGPLIGGYRCTIHVPDLLFAETFYQLVDYYPNRIGGTTHGRIWSMRFGIIGQTWRLEESQVIGQVYKDKKDLIRYWGMTSEQAEIATRDNQSFLCVLLKSKGVTVGLFYMDAKEVHQFGRDQDQELLDKVEEACTESGLTDDEGECDAGVRTITSSSRGLPGQGNRGWPDT